MYFSIEITKYSGKIPESFNYFDDYNQSIIFFFFHIFYAIVLALKFFKVYLNDLV